ncbi:MAG: tRNA (N6-threonylcarbamoyladenosine(37)-N6)-methyltransferase TrmO [Paludibacteraceae bacterium]|nr:tRNA (N6-threonylcarbamoyladenosine(37)-N6)-methyltransferase TrmO [Paludibacteraceae bacterium]
MELKVIAYARNGHSDKFGIPRQSREESPILTRIVFEPEYSVPEALRGIEGYSHLWLIWGFSEGERLKVKGERGEWSPTVRPPRLGGNKRMGVFATRSPFRPNPLGLSSVRLIGIENGDLIVSGADVLDGTPIYDIKPYLSFSDSHPDAQNGFAEETKDYRLVVRWDMIGLITYQSPTNHLLITYYSPTNNILLDGRVKDEMEYILSQDPRPAYQDDPEREYKLDYAGYTITFLVNRQEVIVKKLEKTSK